MLYYTLNVYYCSITNKYNLYLTSHYALFVAKTYSTHFMFEYICDDGTGIVHNCNFLISPLLHRPILNIIIVIFIAKIQYNIYVQ